jgi:predicted outer membrane repeat protein
MANEEGSHPTLINTTFSSNQAGYGGGGGIYNTDSNPTLVNCILWGNDASTDPELHNIGTSVPNLTYSDVYWAEGIYTGTGNLNLDPQFVSPVTATVAPTTTGDYRLLSTSPVIDAGNNFSVTVSVDRDGNPRLMNVPEIADTGLGTPPIVDMGAYEVQVEVATLTVSMAGAGVGVIGSTPAGIDCSLTCTAQFTRGSVITLTATSGTGSAFAGWNGDLSGRTNPITLTMNADKSITGTFTLNTYTLRLYTIGNGMVTSNPPGQTFAYGTVVTLTAIPNAHWAFTGWLGALSGRTNPITLTMDANKIVIAIFRPGHQR